MRGIYYTGVFLVASAAIAIILLILFPQAFPQNVAATFGITVPPAAEPKPPDPPEEKKEPAKKKAFHPLPQNLPAAPEVAVAAPVLPAPAVREPDPPRFPLAQDIPKGMLKSAIVATFGPPETIISGADGQLRERLLYVEKNTGRKTFIFIANGRANNAETLLQ